jgi:hypothetical protein
VAACTASIMCGVRCSPRSLQPLSAPARAGGAEADARGSGGAGAVSGGVLAGLRILSLAGTAVPEVRWGLSLNTPEGRGQMRGITQSGAVHE